MSVMVSFATSKIADLGMGKLATIKKKPIHVVIPLPLLQSTLHMFVCKRVTGNRLGAGLRRWHFFIRTHEMSTSAEESPLFKANKKIWRKKKTNDRKCMNAMANHLIR